MDTTQRSPTDTACFELCFQSLFDAGRSFAFPCDAGGHVDLGALSGTQRTNYWYVRTLIGRDYSAPTVRAGAPSIGTAMPGLIRQENV
jgi:hypothetical protein